ncbi:alpha/beta hydrolase fold domain-containing protein [soil metagenome]
MTTGMNPTAAAKTTSWQNRAHIASTRLLGSILGHGDWPINIIVKRAGRARRRPRSPVDAPPAKRAVRGLTVTRTEHSNWPIWTLQNPEPSPLRVILYFHGGGYVGQANTMQYTWCANIARNTGATVVVPIYPLAPIGTAATVVPVAADLIDSLLATHGPETLTVTGDSAGGGLALAAVQELVRHGRPTPAQLVLISPWLDVTVSDPASTGTHIPAAGVKLLRAGGRLWAGDAEPDNPQVSPLFGSMAGLPPITVFGSTFDVLHPDTVRLQQRALAEGVTVDTVIEDGLIHVWPLYAHLPEAQRVQPLLHNALTGLLR